eukprot:CAMPEP_0185020112 /NCGR_PEP_ID=MMETSP1103-20130426/2712_1 /TAXON_ID=36769 /ORGANISM="Paraphysomonas bandaiensis, Strain Caron Lab Isolate" /LENGTH=292 /DNA_ID=CAMNT_0027550827 /DNA_START=281 /DNA_END=1159 /DNA_ORIENTATION=-
MSYEERIRRGTYHPRKRPRHTFEQNEEAKDYLDEMLEMNRSVKLRLLTLRFNEEYFGQHCPDSTSLATVYRTIKLDNTRKKVAWKNIRKNPEEQIQFLEDISHISAGRIVDIDGMVQSSGDFSARYGWTPRGEDCERAQIQIGGRSFAVHAAYTELGFLAWHIFEGTVSDNEVIFFLKSIAPLLNDDAYGLFDNAANQRTEAVRIVIGDTFREYYMYCAPFSPELKPIEHGFAAIKNFIRERDDELRWRDDPVGLINFAFRHYSIGQSGGLQAYHHFDLYRDNFDVAACMQN